ncbi:MAG: mechanosensitive ion channel family protein [Saccharofermentans sp.]|nr:mechanosensitive ion channel family protein [Saccharofermentans sp.]
MDWNTIIDMVSKVLNLRLLVSALIVVLAIVIYKLIMKLMDAGEKKNKKGILDKGKNRTYFKLIKNLIGSALLIFTVLVVLQVNGVNVTSLLAGVGIASAVIGLALQDWLKDMIRGATMLTDDYFDVGDMVKIQGKEGIVISLGLKTTKIKELATGNLISIANRQIESAEVVANLIYYKIPMPYEVKLDKAEKAVNDIVEIMKQSNVIKDAKYLGVTELADSKIEYLCEIKCAAVNKYQVRRDCNKATIEGLNKNGIEVPYNKLTIIEDK